LIGEAALLSGDLELAAAELAEARDLHHDLGSAAGEAHCLERLAEVRIAQGDLDAANALLDQARSVFRPLASGAVGTTILDGARQFGDVITQPRTQTAFNAIVKPVLRWNNFGWNLGGPLLLPFGLNKNREKFFFFVAQDFKRLRTGSTTTWTVPSQQNLHGDFSNLASRSWPKDPDTGSVYPDGIIPASVKNPNGVKLLNIYPAPNFARAVLPFAQQHGAYRGFNEEPAALSTEQSRTVCTTFLSMLRRALLS
jgi:hypothetical protein